MEAIGRPPVLVDVVIPREWGNTRASRLAVDVALMSGFALLVALCAQIAVRLPWTPVPITGQTFAVLVTGGALGAWRGAGSLSIYMVMGMIAVPVFAGSIFSGAYSTVTSAGQLIFGGELSPVNMVCRHELVLPQSSAANHVRSIRSDNTLSLCVTVEVKSQVSIPVAVPVAAGSVELPGQTEMSSGQVSTGASLSTTVTI